MNKLLFSLILMSLLLFEKALFCSLGNPNLLEEDEQQALLLLASPSPSNRPPRIKRRRPALSDPCKHSSPKKRKISVTQEEENERQKNGIIYFIEQAGDGNLEYVKTRLREEDEEERRRLLNTQNNSGHTALIAAILFKATRVASYLLRNDVNIHIRNSVGMTSFMVACMLNNSELVERLLPFSNLATTDGAGRTALDIINSRDLDESEYQKIRDLITKQTGRPTQI